MLVDKGVSLSIKRLDLIHPFVSGNKYYKLKYNFIQAKKEGLQKILTFGGTFSNHIHATAALADQSGLNSIGIIRGEETLPLNPTLSFAKEKGMEIVYWDREKYRLKHTEGVLKELQSEFGSFYLIPEGGTNDLAVRGTSEILSEQDLMNDQIALCIGTGGTFAGLASAISPHQNLLGFSSLKGDFIQEEIKMLLRRYEIHPHGTFQVLDQYHFGGYAKHSPFLLSFILEFYKQTSIPLDPIYTGKMMFGLMDLVEKDFFKPGTSILAIHTGGLQGIRGFNQLNSTALPLK